ncbi:hypothetical protein BJ878DRAFT_520612 [Calycina marina]|uniref:Crossover junction endonuclease MUS81 n=1 Tax=Calycina marina TaxID=1763456 RepID=A0A9P7YY02_9HELO|nr:hypothetical protein BJ878DRAFT_520612 [Calycina marina]
MQLSHAVIYLCLSAYSLYTNVITNRIASPITLLCSHDPNMPEPATCANPLLLKWLEEWLEVEKQRGARGVNTYKKAYDAIKACPLTFAHPSESKQLKGIGELLVKKLTQKMEEFCAENGLPMQTIPRGRKRATVPGEDYDEDGEFGPSPAKKKKTTKAYVPKLRSGAFAILVALGSTKQYDDVGLTKTEIISLAEDHCDSSFTVPEHANKFYTAWKSMETLLGNNLVYTKTRPVKRFLLTDEGWEVANSLRKASGLTPGEMGDFVERNGESPKRPGKSKSDANIDWIDLSPSRTWVADSESQQKDNIPDIISRGRGAELPDFEPITIQPSAYTVHMVLDNREVRAKKDRTHIQTELGKHGVTPIMRAMTLGDVTWIAKVHDPKLLSSLGGDVDEGDEVILDWIVERKRLDDLIGSIKDGRFHEQKFRMRKSGMKNVIYVIEEYSMDSEVLAKSAAMVESAITSTQVVEGYFLKRTGNLDATIKYLAIMTKMLQNDIYKGMELHVIPSRVITATNYLPMLQHLRTMNPGTYYHITYCALGSLVSKSSALTLRDVYLKMLMCIRGVTGEKALEIQKIWKTPVEFAEAYEQYGNDEESKKQKMQLVVGKLGNMIARKKIQKTLSAGISKIWGEFTIEGGN